MRLLSLVCLARCAALPDIGVTYAATGRLNVLMAAVRKANRRADAFQQQRRGAPAGSNGQERVERVAEARQPLLNSARRVRGVRAPVVDAVRPSRATTSSEPGTRRTSSAAATARDDGEYDVVSGTLPRNPNPYMCSLAMSSSALS